VRAVCNDQSVSRSGSIASRFRVLGAGAFYAAGAALLVTAARWWTSSGRRVFHMTPDEPRQLAIARYVGGRMARWNMLDHSTSRPGYGTLIAPISWFTEDPATGFRAALGVNAVLGGCSCVVLYLLARRLTQMSPLGCAASALVVSLSPAVLFTTDWVWSEALVSATYLAAVLALLRFHESPTIGRGVALVTVAVAGFAAHSRLLPLSVVTLGVIVLAARRARISQQRAVGLAAYLGAMLLATSWYSKFLTGRIWENPHDTNSAGGVLDRLTKVGPIFVSVIGQTWYQLVTTAGIAGIGTIVMIRSALRNRPAARPTTDDARLLVAAVGALVALSMVFMSDRWRSDQLVYGRYNDAVLGPVLVLGIGWLVTQRRVVEIARTYGFVTLATIASGAVLCVVRDDELRADAGVRAMILGLQSFVGDTPSIRVLHISLLALVVFGVVVATALLGRVLHRPWTVVVAFAVLALAGNARTRTVIDANLNSWETAGAVQSVRGAELPAGATFRFKLVPDGADPAATYSHQRQRAMLYQFYLPDNSMYLDGQQPTDRSDPYVFAPLDDPGLVAAGAVVVWRDPSVAIGLWVEPGPESAPNTDSDD
jgi:hypothetical protein